MLRFFSKIDQINNYISMHTFRKLNKLKKIDDRPCSNLLCICHFTTFDSYHLSISNDQSIMDQVLARSEYSTIHSFFIMVMETDQEMNECAQKTK